ncbi:hypothetical protein AXG89_41470 (plasmid) [Burkholderia sp. PAMC 26561]|nr:hypothetical protein AXG89_27695 [Burkholderia sp. PAMC 26561]AMH42800.1 hypothetical protein AXG89_41470 [Burkholderia sp. PAMC 26561]
MVLSVIKVLPWLYSALEPKPVLIRTIAICRVLRMFRLADLVRVSDYLIFWRTNKYLTLQKLSQVGVKQCFVRGLNVVGARVMFHPLSSAR